MGGAYKVIPGQSVGEFILGDSLWHILDILRTKKIQYPRIEVSWDVEKPVTSAITISLPHLTLYFPPSSHQTLALISLPDLSKSTLRLEYESTTLSAPGQVFTRGKVGKILGPTFAGSDGKLSYPGISFTLGDNPSTGGLSTVGGRDDMVRSLVVVPKSESDGATPLSPLVSCTVQPGRGVTLLLPDPLDIILHETTAQDLLLDLGPPLRKFYKEDNRLERMWASTESPEGSCFWNYFQYGLDFLIDPEGTVIKIICHTNIPGTPLFQRYARCPWVLPSPESGDLTYTNSLSAIRDAFSPKNRAENPGYNEDTSLAVPMSNERPNIASGKKKKKKAPSSANGQEQLHLQPGSGEHSPNSTDSPVPSPAVEQDALVLDRTVEGGLDGVIGLGSSRLVGFPGLVLEEDAESGGITSLLVFPDASAANGGNKE